ncbi:GNAT family N-acetyltransferase [Filobacillus milosensis]|uniref:GNAT family N-acetyltransferase n=1 Tax=Filobacillus milosensis TaxID=94137 RepID=A0A4Y8IN94_9BACI|nr:GNAT family N-acetyltransferase [Filobacillus milosensis]TFB22799.1 GNAT family N-acetyltransferase [Filobacillus milosensis]
MREIREIKQDELKDMNRIEQLAYTALRSVTQSEIDERLERYKKMLNEDPEVSFHGLFENNELRGSMKLYDFSMNVFGKFLPTGGVGSVAVDLLHKKEKVAKDLITYYLNYYDEKGFALAALYPFRPDFYYQMGFGYGTKKDSYKVKPSAFPNFKNKQGLSYLTKKDSKAVVDCYNEFASRHHGMFRMEGPRFDDALESLKVKTIGVKRNGKVTGFAVFSFKPESDQNFLSNNIHIHQIIYTDRDALQQLSTFFHTQNDQVNRIIFLSQDSDFHHLFDDARDDSDVLIPSVYHQTNTSGLGLMYRVINVKRFFQQLGKHNFNGVSTTVEFNINDTFFENNNELVTVMFNNGKPTVAPGAKSDVTIYTDISDFSSLVLGVVDFKKLHLFGRTEVSNEEHMDTLEQLFYSKEKPVCTTAF